MHVHLDATVDPQFIMSLALNDPAIHICVPNALTSSNLKTTLPQLRPLPPDEFTSALGFDSAEVGTWVGLRTARENFDVSLGGKEGFDKWVVGCMTINPGEAYGTHNTVAKVFLHLPL